MVELSVGYSPCPNDTFIFYGLVHGKVPLEGITLREQLEDIETLNRMAHQEKLDISKVSYHAFGYLRNRYALLRSGAAMGKGCGPLLVMRDKEEVGLDLTRQRIAIPGELTTAFLLLRLYEPRVSNIIILPFNQILQAIQQGEADAGLIIHESRFTYQHFGLRKVLDLGDFWEKESGGFPLPLGGIMARRTLGPQIARKIEEGIRQSIHYDKAHLEEAKDYIRQHAQEIEDEVIFSHIALYVNEYTLDIGQVGEEAIRLLLTKAEARGLIPPSSADDALFW